MKINSLVRVIPIIMSNLTPLPPRLSLQRYRKNILLIKVAILISLLAIIVGFFNDRIPSTKETFYIQLEAKYCNCIVRDSIQNQSYVSTPQVEWIREEKLEEIPNSNYIERKKLNLKDYPNIFFYKNAIRSGLGGFYIEDFYIKQ